MRKSVFIFFILLGSATGVFAALEESPGQILVLGSIGAIAGAVIGGALSGLSRQHRRSMTDFEMKDGLTLVQDEQAHNYWLDSLSAHLRRR